MRRGVPPQTGRGGEEERNMKEMERRRKRERERERSTKRQMVVNIQTLLALWFSSTAISFRFRCVSLASVRD